MESVSSWGPTDAAPSFTPPGRPRLDKIRSGIAAALSVVAPLHVGLYVASGWIARTFLAQRTLDGERLEPERWVVLLHAMIVRSGFVACAALGLALTLASVRRTREELFAFFTAPSGPINLAVFRIVCFATFLLVWDTDQTLFFARLPRVLVQGLSDPLPLWRLIVPSPELAPVMVRVFLACASLACVGLFTRVAAFGVCLSGFYVLGLPQLYGKVNHYHHMLWFALILGLSPSGDALSVDALLRRAAGGSGTGRAPPRKSVAYALPLKLIGMLIGVMYFWPGFWKLVQHGPAWVFSDNFANHLYLKWFEDPTFTPLFRIDHYPALCRLAAASALTFELAFIFMVPFRRTRPIALGVGLVFHNLTYLLMNIAFLSLQIYYLVFADWDAVGAWLGKHAFPREGSLRRVARQLLGRLQETLRPVARLLPQRPRAEPRVQGAVVAGLALLAVNTGYGVMHQTDAWPFACYPTFSSLVKSERRSLFVRIESGGVMRPARTAGVLEAFRSERYAAVVRGILAERDQARRRLKLAALAAIVRSLDPTIQIGETIVIAEAMFAMNPDEDPAPRREERLYAVRVDAQEALEAPDDVAVR